MLQEAGVASYKDSEVEIVFAPLMGSAQPVQQFDFNKYDSEEAAPQENAANAETDDLGFTEEDYLYRSAGQ